MQPATYRSYRTASTGSGYNMFATYPELGGGTYYADQRMYNPQVGKSFSPDPMGVAGANPRSPASWNRYGYGQGDPINLYDPSGEYVLIPGEGGGVCPAEYSTDECIELGYIIALGGGEGGGGGCGEMSMGLLL